MTELEKFVKILREQLAVSRMATSIGDIQKFVYQKNDYTVVNLEQLSMAYCEKFIDPNPEKYYKSFIRFSGRAMAYAYRQARFEFVFSYHNTQVIKNINLNDYRHELRNFLVKKFEDFIIEVAWNNEMTMQVKSYIDDGKRRGLESKVEQAVYNYNRYNPDYAVHAATYFSLTDYYGHEKQYFSVNF